MPCSSACSNVAENLRYQRKGSHFGVLAAREKRFKKTCFRRSGVTSPNSTAKPSWGWLRVGVRKPRLVLAEFSATWNKVTATPRSYWLLATGAGCPHNKGVNRRRRALFARLGVSGGAFGVHGVVLGDWC